MNHHSYSPFTILMRKTLQKEKLSVQNQVHVLTAIHEAKVLEELISQLRPTEHSPFKQH